MPHDLLQPDDIVPGDVHVITPAIVASPRVSQRAVGELDLS